MLEIYPWLVFLMSSLFATFGLYVYFSNKSLPESKIFLFLSVSFASWGYSWYGMLIVQRYDIALLFAKLLNLGAAFIPVFYFHWVSLVLDAKHKYRNVLTFFYFLTAILLPFAFTNYYVEGVYKIFGMFYWPLAGSAYIFYIVIVYLGIISWAFVLLVKEFYKTTGDKKHQIGLIIIGSIFGFGGGLTNFPLMYGVGFPPFGILTLLISPVILGYAAARYHLFNIKLIAAELLTFIIWGVLLLDLFNRTTISEYIESGIVLVFSLFAGIFLIRSVKKEVAQREQIEELAGRVKSVNRIMSHDIKNVLGKNKDMFGMLLDGSFGAVSEMAKPFLEQVFSDTKKLIRSVIVILESGQDLILKPTPFDLKEAVLEVVREVAHDADTKTKNITVSSAIDESGTYTIVADRAQLVAHVIRNLIENAVNYNIANGSVTVRLSQKDAATFLFSVTDTGIGISDEDKPNMFKEGGHGKDSIKYNVHTTGYGLATAKRTTEAHGGKIWFETEVGKGTTFLVELPVYAESKPS